MATTAQPGTAPFLVQLLHDALAGKYITSQNQQFTDVDPYRKSAFSNTVNDIGSAVLAAPFNIVAGAKNNIIDPMKGLFQDNFVAPVDKGIPNPALPPEPTGVQPGIGAPALPPSLPGAEAGADPLSTVIGALSGSRPGGPDYSEMDSWLEQARPTATDPAMIKKLQRDALFQGLASGAANIDSSAPGSLGAAIAALGAGASSGKAAGDKLAYQDQSATGEDTRNYALKRAEVAGSRANAAAAAAKDLWESQQPKVLHADGDNVVVQQANPKTGQIEIKNVPIGGPLSASKNILMMARAFGKDNDIAKGLQYDYLASSGNEPAYKIQMVEDSVDDGSAPLLFGEAYAKHLADVKDEYEPTGDTKIDAENIKKQVIMRLYKDLDGNDDWIIQAAKMGNPGAIKLIQHGG